MAWTEQQDTFLFFLQGGLLKPLKHHTIQYTAYFVWCTILFTSVGFVAESPKPAPVVPGLSVVNLFVTKCKGVCSPAMNNLARVRRELQRNHVSRVTFTSYAVTPDGDTPATLQAYARKNQVPKEWQLIAGLPPASEGLDMRSFGVDGENVLLMEAKPTPQGSRRELRAIYDGRSRRAMRQLTEDLLKAAR